MDRVVFVEPMHVRRRCLRALIASLALTVIAVTGCDSLDDLLDVDLSGQIEAVNAELPAKAAMLVDGGVTLFNCAFGIHVTSGAYLGEEMSGNGGVDARNVTADEGPNANRCVTYYGTVSHARWNLDHTLQLLEGWSDAEVANRTTLIARAAVFSGYTHLLIGEGFCTAAIDGGPELQPADVFQRGETRFTRAIEAATAANNTQLLNLARVGRARARLNLGRYAEARADAVLVPEGFVERVVHAATAPGVNENRVFLMATTIGGANITVDVLYQEARFSGVRDPRIPVVNTGQRTAEGRQLWRQTKYSATNSPIELATWEEARLIVAEADARAGSLGSAVAIINQLHARVGLPDFNSAGQAEILQQILYERRAELFLEGQHLGDYRRFQIPLAPPSGTPYPGRAGVFYGTARCYLLPNWERVGNLNIT